MNSLFAVDARREMSDRIGRISPSAAPRFGVLTVDRMVVHLIDGLRLAFGEVEPPFQPSFLSTPLGRWLVIDSPVPWPKGRIKAGEVFFRTAPAVEFECDRRTLLEYVERFAQGPNQRWGTSPFLGGISPDQWARLNYRHLDHHLRQFGT